MTIISTTVGKSLRINGIALIVKKKESEKEYMGAISKIKE